MVTVLLHYIMINLAMVYSISWEYSLIMAQVKNEHMISILQMSREVFQLIVTQILQINEEASEYVRENKI